MRYSDWMQLTERGTFTPRSNALERVDRALLAFNKSGLKSDLIALEQSLNAWKQTKDDWTESVRNESQSSARKDAYVKPVNALTDWIAKRRRMFESDKSEAIPALQRAARVVMEKYGPLLEEAYRGALNENFVAQAEHVYCFKRYESDGDWTRHVQETRAGQDHDLQEGDIVNGVTPTIFPRVERVGGQYVWAAENLKGAAPPAPYNRRIEFREIRHHTLVHEMLHWCCHEQFRLGSSRSALGEHFEYVLEGLTEWLTRNALDEWESGGYERIMGAVRAAVEAGHPHPATMIAAYFRGEQVTSMARDMIEYITVTLPGLQSAEGKARVRRDLLANMAKAARLRDPANVGDDYKERMKAAFSGADSAPALLQRYPQWIQYLRTEGVIA